MYLIPVMIFLVTSNSDTYSVCLFWCRRMNEPGNLLNRFRRDHYKFCWTGLWIWSISFWADVLVFLPTFINEVINRIKTESILILLVIYNQVFLFSFHKSINVPANIFFHWLKILCFTAISVTQLSENVTLFTHFILSGFL